MTTKNTILISAATCLAVHFLLWLLGWMVWPIVWAASGILTLKVGDFLASEEAEPWMNYVAAILGPIMMIGFIWACIDGYFDFGKISTLNWFKTKLPSIRNPFIWPND